MSDAYDKLKSRKKAIRRHVDLCLDSDVADAHEAALERVRVAERDYEADKTGAKRKVLTDARAEEEFARTTRDGASQRFTVQNISRAAYIALLEEHPPTEAQLQETLPPDFDVETFGPALIAACIVDPPLTESEVLELWHDPTWSVAELQQLFFAANNANAQSKVVDLGKGSGSTPA